MRPHKTIEVDEAPSLDTCETKQIAGVRDWMVDESDACQHGICPDQRAVFLAIIAWLDDALVNRNRRAKRAVKVMRA